MEIFEWNCLETMQQIMKGLFVKTKLCSRMYLKLTTPNLWVQIPNSTFFIKIECRIQYSNFFWNFYLNFKSNKQNHCKFLQSNWTLNWENTKFLSNQNHRWHTDCATITFKSKSEITIKTIKTKLTKPKNWTICVYFFLLTTASFVCYD